MRFGRKAAVDRLEPRAQFGERRAQIVGDGVGGIAHTVDEQLDLCQHFVDGPRQPPELVVARADRETTAEIALHDRLGGAVDLGDAGEHGATHHQPAADRQARAASAVQASASTIRARTATRL